MPNLRSSLRHHRRLDNMLKYLSLYLCLHRKFLLKICLHGKNKKDKPQLAFSVDLDTTGNLAILDIPSLDPRLCVLHFHEVCQ